MKRISIFIQLVLIMFMISAIPAVAVIYINSVSMRKNTEEAVAESALNKIRANAQLSDQMLTYIIYDALDLVLAKQYYDLNGVTTYDMLNSQFDYVNAAMKIQSSLSDLSNRNEMVHSILYYMENTDYGISNEGFVRLKGSPEAQWLKEAESKVRGAEGIWYPRTLTREKNGQKTSQEVVSYLYQSSSLYTSAKVTIVVNVYEEEISNLIYSDIESTGGEGFLMTGDGEVIAHSNSQYLYTNIGDEEYVSPILQSKNKSGYGVTESGNYLYTYSPSSLYEWIYVNVYSLDEIYAQSKQITQTGILMTLLIILIGAACAVWFSRRISRPIRELTDEVRGTKSHISNTKNEIMYLSGAFGEIKEREKQLKVRLSEREESIRRTAVSSLIHGEAIPDQERKMLETFFPYDHFMVCVLSIDHYSAYEASTSHEERKNRRAAIYEKLREVFPQEYVLEGVRYNVSSLAVLINFKNYDSDQVKALFCSALGEVQTFSWQVMGQSLSIGISQVHSCLDRAGVCTEEANEALKRRLLLGSGSLIFFRRTQNSEIRTYAGYLHEKRIMNYLEVGDLGKIQEELNAVAEDLKKMEFISVDNVMMVFNQMVGSILLYLSGHHLSPVSVFGGGQSNLYSRLAEMETIEEIIIFLGVVCGKVIACQKTDEEVDDRDYARMILDYIQLNYKEDIDYENLCREIGISYSYARKIIRERTGKSLIDNLNEIRIREAKLLLERTEMTVAEVASAVGYHNVQSLYRFFKKFEGLSPKDYQASLFQNHQEK